MHRPGWLVVCLSLGVGLFAARSAWADETVSIGEITGTVLMPDGSPAAGAQVRVIGFRLAQSFPIAYEGLCSLETETAEDGTFHLKPEPIATEGLSAHEMVMLSVLVTHPDAGLTGTTDQRKAPEVGEAFDAGTLTLREPTTLAGTVTDAEGQPLAEATVILVGWVTEQGTSGLQILPEVNPLRVVTQPDGTFAFERMPPGGRFMLFVQKEGYPDAFLMSAAAPASIVLPEAGSLTGVVSSAEGKPLADCRVWCAPQASPEQGQTGPWMIPTSVVTGADGSFTVPTLFPVAYDLRVEPPASGENRWAPGILTNHVVTAGETLDVGEVVLTPGGVIAGNVIDAEAGKPLPEVRVSAGAQGARSMAARWFATTDAEGRYEFHLPAGTYQMNAFVSGYAQRGTEPRQPTQVSLEVGGRAECDFELHPVFSVKGTLLLPDGSPARNCTIRGTTSSNPYLYARTDGSGRFSLERVSPGEKVDISASDPEHGARLTTSFTVPEDKTELTFTMESVPTCVVTGRVVDDDGNPVSGVQVSIYESAGNVSHQAGTGSTDADGRFRITALRGGEGYISVGSIGGIIPDDRRLELNSDTIEKGDLLYPRLESEVAGVVVDIDGQPIAGARVNARGVAKQGYANAQTGADGRFHLTKLPNDTLQVEAYLVEPDTRIIRHHVRDTFAAGTTDVWLVMAITQRTEEVVLSTGDQAPELVLEEGAGVSLAQFKDKPVVLAFVSIYSRLCVKVLDELSALQVERGADKVGVIAVHDRTASPEEIEQFRKDHGITFPIVRAPDAPRDGWDSDTFRAYGVSALPSVTFIDREGKVLSTGDGTGLPEDVSRLLGE